MTVSSPELSLRSRRGPVFLLGLAIGLAFFVNLGNAPLFDRDEGAFSEATREMVTSGNYLTTTLNGEPRYDKPILTYYAQRVGVALLGWNEWGLRIHSAVAAALWVFFVWGFGRREWDETTGWVAGLLTATSLWVMIIGRAATADAILNLFLALTLFDLYRFWKEGGRKPLYRVFFWSGLGFLTKGPIAVAIPVASAFLLALFRRGAGRYVRAIFNPVGWLIFFGTAAPWYVAAYRRDGPAFIDGLFLRHNLNRFVDTMEGHGGAVYYFALIILAVLLPHTSLFLKTLGRVKKGFGNDLELFLWLWFGFVFLFFSLSSTQLPHYILYGATPLFLLMARHRQAVRNRFLTLLPALFLTSILLFLPELWRIAEPMVTDDYILAILSVAPEAFDLGYRIPMALGFAWLLVLLIVRGLAPWQRLVGSGLGLAGMVAFGLFPTAGEIQQGPTKEAAQLAREQGWDVVMWRLDMPSFAVYYGDITPLREPEPGEVVFTRVDRYDQLAVPTDVVFQKGGIVLARARDGGESETDADANLEGTSAPASEPAYRDEALTGGARGP
jgi:4-amino-4-deoxy-L-arabinose transferase-like glycosyltransferase